MIWPFKTKITEKRNYDRKDLAFSFQSQITVLLPQLILAEQIHSPAFLEQARIQSSVVLEQWEVERLIHPEYERFVRHFSG